MIKLMTGISLLLLASLFCIISIGQCITAKLKWDNDVGYLWNMADKSSTLAGKSKYINEFIIALKDLPHEENAAIFWKTRDNNFDLNLQALQTLGNRLHEVQKLDINSFAYQTAIQQITEQEQGEAAEMVGTLRGAWVLNQYWWAFNTVIIWVWAIWFVALIWFLIALLLKLTEY